MHKLTHTHTDKYFYSQKRINMGQTIPHINAPPILDERSVGVPLCKFKLRTRLH